MKTVEQNKSGPRSPRSSDVNKDWTCKDKDKDKDQAYKDQDKDKDLTHKDRISTSLTVTYCKLQLNLHLVAIKQQQ